MKFRLDHEAMFVTPENREEAKEVHEEIRLFSLTEQPFEYGTWLNQHSDGIREVQLKGRWVDLFVSAPPKFIQPYLGTLRHWTGHNAFDRPVELTSAWDPITPYFIPKSIWLLGNGWVDAVVYTDYYDGPGGPEDTFERLEKRTQEHLCENLGHRPYEKEFIHTANGQYQHNPRYGTGYRHPPKEGRGGYATSVHTNIWRLIWKHWMMYHANDEQRRVMANALRINDPLDHPRIDNYTLYVLDPKGTCNYDGNGKMVTVYRAEEFAKLGQGGTECKPSTATDATITLPPETTETP